MKFLVTFALLFSAALPSFATSVALPQVIELQVTEKGFEPKTINVKPGIPVTLNITRKTDLTCATAIQIPSKKIKRDLPLNQLVVIELGVLEKGEIRFACGMDMETGIINVR